MRTMKTLGGTLGRRLRKKLGRKRYEEVLSLALDKVSSFTVERDPLIVSGIVEGTFHYSAYIDETGEYCCACQGQTTHKTICKHILAIVLHGYLNNRLSEYDVISLIGGELK